MKRALPMDQVLVGRTSIHYEIRRSPRRTTLGIEVCQGVVRVAAPARMRATAIRPIVAKCGAWILRKLEEDRRNGNPRRQVFVSGAAIRYLGRQYPLQITQVAQGKPARLEFTGGVFHVRCDQGDGPEASRSVGIRLLRRWFRIRLREILPRMVETHAKALGVATPPFRVIELGNRWGSCRPPHGLLFHWHLASAPPRLIEFVVAHEICHLKHPDHNQAFYRALKRILPDATEREKSLARMR